MAEEKYTAKELVSELQYHLNAISLCVLKHQGHAEGIAITLPMELKRLVPRTFEVAEGHEVQVRFQTVKGE